MNHPAFPSQSDHGNGNTESWIGISALEYFMAHAPHHPQPWFKPASDAANASDEYEKQRFLQWPRAWAVEQLRIAQS